MTKLMKKIRAILKALADGAKITISVALSVPGFLKFEVEYARELDPDDLPVDRGWRRAARALRRGRSSIGGRDLYKLMYYYVGAVFAR